jgi:hypothetical protein
MTGFWESDLGEVTGKAEDAFAKQFTMIPDGTMALARVESFVNDTNSNGFKCLIVVWMLTDGDFKGAKVSQKIKVFGGEEQYDKDPAKTRHRALNMLKLLYQQFGLKPKTADAPTDADLSVFVGKIAGIKVRETEPNSDNKTFNWVSEVHPSQGFKCETGIKLAFIHTPSTKDDDLFDSAFSRNQKSPHASSSSSDVIDDVPF